MKILTYNGRRMPLENMIGEATFGLEGAIKNLDNTLKIYIYLYNST